MWVVYSLFSAISWATSDACIKGLFRRQGWAEVTVTWGRFAVALPLVALTAIPHFTPLPDKTFWALTLAWLPLEVAAVLLYVRAVRLSPLSLTVPFLALTPVFLLFTSWLMLGERPGARGAAGVLSVAVGSYFLNLRGIREGVWGPIRALAREPGTRLMVGVALIYSVSANLGKMAVLHSSPQFFGLYYTLLLSLVLLPGARPWTRMPRQGRPLLFLLAGLSYGAMILFHMLAIERVEVAYMISVKRTSVLFSVLSGILFFGERGAVERLLGSALMVLGVALITL